MHAFISLLCTDVKPSNILINKRGEIKLCDFGIAGELVNSYVGTNIGCKPYLAPERINPIRMDDPYDQRSDVWSYGITIVSHGLDACAVVFSNWLHCSLESGKKTTR